MIAGAPALRAVACAGEHLRVTRLGLGLAAFGAGRATGDVLGGAADFLVGAPQDLGQGQLDVLGDALDLGHALVADIIEERSQRLLVEPPCDFGDMGDLGQRVGLRGRGQIADHAGFDEANRPRGGELDGEEAFVITCPSPSTTRAR